MLANSNTLPGRILLVIPGIDILVAEQTEFAKRINEEDSTNATSRVEIMLEKELFHGYLEGMFKLNFGLH